MRGEENGLREMTADEFARRLRRYEQDSGKRFAFFLGAGCSRSSGIPLAGELVKAHWLPRLRDLEAPDRTDLEAWASEIVPAYDPRSPATAYGELIDRLFITPEDRQQEIESLCEGRSPGFGYAVLAHLIARASGQFNVVLTTNFDDMVADALYLYTDARPLVIHHASLAAYIRPTRTRPLVVKLHGDHRLSPRNTRLETAELEADIAHHTAMALHDRGLVFMGYGGNDESIHKLLKGLPRAALPQGIYWVDKDPPSGPIRAWLLDRGAVWVKGGYFDEVMLLVRNAFDLPHPDPGRFTRIFEGYHKTFQDLSSEIGKKAATAPDILKLKEAVKKAEESFPDEWQIISAALRLHEGAPEEAERIYRQGIDQFGTSAPLFGNYAYFLSEVRKDPDKAEPFYKRALEADPQHAPILGSYAYFLSVVRKDPDKAEPFYKRALEADPQHAHTLANYAFFLSDVRKDPDKAEPFYKRAIEADPQHANTLANYAFFLSDVRKDPDKAEELYKRAIEADPQHANNLGSYAFFLSDVRKDPDKAEELYKRAIEADPQHAHTLRSYAFFLSDVRKDPDKAEELYKRATEADPQHAHTLGSYAFFLSNVRKDPDKAEPFYKRAIEVAPQDANTLGNYAGTLLAIGRQTDGLSMLDRALNAPDASLGLHTECWFYALAHRASERRGEALAQLKRLIIGQGARSPGWDLSGNVERARSDGHPDAAWLALLADVINEKADPAVLQAWPAWAAA